MPGFGNTKDELSNTTRGLDSLSFNGKARVRIPTKAIPPRDHLSLE